MGLQFDGNDEDDEEEMARSGHEHASSCKRAQKKPRSAKTRSGNLSRWSRLWLEHRAEFVDKVPNFPSEKMTFNVMKESGKEGTGRG